MESSRIIPNAVGSPQSIEITHKNGIDRINRISQDSQDYFGKFYLVDPVTLYFLCDPRGEIRFCRFAEMNR